MTPLVSITVPIYNVEEYLDQCISCLARQTLKEIEIILVDDGSTDSSPLICDTWAKKDNRIKVIHKANGGSASARQEGLDNSTGEYIIVCDGDDWVELDMYEKLYQAAHNTNADIVFCQHIAEYSDGRSVQNISLLTNVDDYDSMISEIFAGKISGSTWNKLVRRQFVIDGNIYYEPNINLSEDYLLFLKIMYLRPRVVQISDCLYHYRRRIGSSSYTNCLYMENIIQMDKITDWLKQHYDTNKYKSVFHQRNIQRIYLCLRTKDLDVAYFKRFLKENILWQDFFKYRLTIKSILAYSSKVLPLSVMLFIFNKTYKYSYK